MKGKIHGNKRQKLAMWRKNYIQNIVAHKAHRNGIRISHVNAWNTSKLAFDGTGKVVRDDKNYSMCKFADGKLYHCDLNASYNIGARYFIREILKTLSATVRSQVETKVSLLAKRTQCTLSTLISMNVALSGEIPSVAQLQ
jgi:transposase